MAYAYDPELAPWIAMIPDIDFSDLAAARSVDESLVEHLPRYEAPVPLKVREMVASGVPVRVYSPADQDGPLPGLVYLHGGGFILGSAEMFGGDAERIAAEVGAVVVSVDYRLAPEHPFPAANDDSVTAYGWVVEHLSELGAQPDRLAVGGDSAGANLATGVAIEAARRGWPLAFQLLVYPVTDQGAQTRSRELFSEGFYLTRRFMDRGARDYLGDSDLSDPRCSPLHADLPGGLAPAAVITAGFDPLRDEGEAYAQKLADAGVDVRLERFPDLIHGFFNMIGLGRRCREANTQVAGMLRDGLA